MCEIPVSTLTSKELSKKINAADETRKSKERNMKINFRYKSRDLFETT